MLHRAIFGSYERFIGILIEHLPGAAGLARAGAGRGGDDRFGCRRLCRTKLTAQLKAAAGIRVETDLRNEKINYKVREHSARRRFRTCWWSASARPRKARSRSARWAQEGQRIMSVDEAVAMLVTEATSRICEVERGSDPERTAAGCAGLLPCCCSPLPCSARAIGTLRAIRSSTRQRCMSTIGPPMRRR
jgi:hypothetical protein